MVEPVGKKKVVGFTRSVIIKKCTLLTVINGRLVVGENEKDNLKDNVRRVDDRAEADDGNEVVAIASCN